MRVPLPVTLAGIVSLGCAPGSDEPAEAPLPDGVYGQAPAAVGSIPTVVTLDAPFVTAETTGDTPVIDQFGLTFSPRQMVVRVGETVLFKNSESIAHNVVLTSVETDSIVLNVDTDPGEATDFIFDTPGGYDVSCNVHPGMTAFVFATSSPYTAIADVDGNFVLSDVAPGSYTLTVWSAGPERASERTVEVGGERTPVEFGPQG